MRTTLHLTDDQKKLVILALGEYISLAKSYSVEHPSYGPYRDMMCRAEEMKTILKSLGESNVRS